MNPAQRHQLAELDRAVLSLLDERARLVAETVAGGGSREAAEPAVEDLLVRHDGPFPVAGVRAVFAAVARACREVLP